MIGSFLSWLFSEPMIKKLPVKPKTVAHGPCGCETKTQWINVGVDFWRCMDCGLGASRAHLRDIEETPGTA
ncbi:hypothetical protein ACS3YM_00205 [Nocardia sp. N13]|uniref:hypothetical protein n=1 Tax=Nocardioides sp. N13(2025) TaxID=3453405 RepID=UPI003F76E1DB